MPREGWGDTHLALDVSGVELPSTILCHDLHDVGVLKGALVHPLHRPHPRHGDGAAHLGSPKHRNSLHPHPLPGHPVWGGGSQAAPTCHSGDLE